MTEADIIATGKRRRCVFRNIANGVPLSVVMEDARLSELEVTNDLKFVLRKIREVRHQRLAAGGTKSGPFADRIIPCETVSDILKYRREMLATLGKIGDITLGTDLFVFSRVVNQTIDSRDAVREVMQRVNYR